MIENIGHSSSSLQHTLDSAVHHHQAGDLTAAKRFYEQVLKADPAHPTALHLLGVVAHQMGKNTIAIELISKAIQFASGNCDMHYNLGNAFKDSGKLLDAVAQYRQAISLKADYADAYFHLGLAFHELARWEEAEETFGTLLRYMPESPVVHFVLGNLYKDQDRFEAATGAYQTAIVLKPDMFEAHANLALVMQKQGRADEAVLLFQKALFIAPDQAQLHYNLGNALRDAGRIEDAVVRYRRALEVMPNLVGAHFNLARVLESLGDPNAFRHFWQAVVLDSGNDGYWTAFEKSVRGLEFTAVDAELMASLDALLNRTNVRPHELARTIVNALKSQPDFGQIVQEVLKPNSNDEVVFERMALGLSNSPVFLRILKLSPLNDLDVERMLTRLRQALLCQVEDGKKLGLQALAFAAALAQQAFANEYVFSEIAAEGDQVEALQKRIAQKVEDGQQPEPCEIIALAAYRPLHMFAWAHRLADGPWPDAVRDVIRCQVTEPLEEHALRHDIVCLSHIDNDVSHAVRDQYEQNPYPRWLKTSLQDRALDFSTAMQKMPFWREPEPFDATTPPQVLIAGCGTGQQALNTASGLSDAQVLAVDLSLSSLSYAQRKTNEFNISNIEYAQADILELGGLDRSFDLIESVGVLHHLADPVRGWKGLVELLRPGGFMKIGLYSELARQSVVEARSLVAERGYASTPQDIRRLRNDVMQMSEAGNTAFAKLLGFADFYTMSGCRDLVFHVQEHRFTLLQIDKILHELNLSFLGLELRRESTREQFQNDHPQSADLYRLASWHDFETHHPDTFMGMYQFWCQKKYK